MLRNKVIYTFLLGSFFLVFGLSVDGSDNIQIGTEESTHWITASTQDHEDSNFLSIEEFNEIRQLDEQLLSKQALYQKELLFMLFNLKKAASLQKEKGIYNKQDAIGLFPGDTHLE